MPSAWVREKPRCILLKWDATFLVGTASLKYAFHGMTVPKKRSNDAAGPELDDRWAWAVIGLIVGCVTLVLWLPLLKQILG